jgi:ubiquinone/menaquinone biosynthesis C-methylase UbiE
MDTQPTSVTTSDKKKPLGRVIQEAIESKRCRKQPFVEYKRFIQDHYDGLAGKLTSVTGVLTGHALLAGRVFKPNAFDLRGCKSILDAGCGNGRYGKYILRRADADAFIASFDLSQRMLKRASKRNRGSRIHYVSADLTKLPYADDSFDAIVCGWVLEHLPDPRHGLKELKRILRPGGKMLLMTTEDTLAGAMCSKLWHCRTYNRLELRQVCEEFGMIWHRPLYFSQLHRIFKLGGIIVELHRPDRS